ncbi:hypothetical protein TD95_000596 [Thielaviopsis punctulata]|uniref:N-acetyltransferase domain-containing protein n=1 Tax=Thielaviopsis punctulata TaxID=72032 RepID=A0A0F4ZKL1_9PEZI|nr:hypothetical protein TD95_000596 [Thielaviopsis punctulata]
MPPAVRLFDPATDAHLVPYLAAVHANCITSDHTIATFLPPLSHDKLLTWWKNCISAVSRGERAMFLLVDEPSPSSSSSSPSSPPPPPSASASLCAIPGLDPALSAAVAATSTTATVTATTTTTTTTTGPQDPVRGADLMGVVMLVMPFSETGPFRGYVEKLLVSPKFRRRGGARALLDALEKEAVKRGRCLLMLDTESGSAAEHLCRRLGWTELGQIPNFGLSPGGGLRNETFFYKQL